MSTDNKKHGGARDGSGRPKLEETKVMRIPIELEETVKAMIEQRKKEKQ